jgi:hypothetical protein
VLRIEPLATNRSQACRKTHVRARMGICRRGPPGFLDILDMMQNRAKDVMIGEKNECHLGVLT